MAGEEDQEVTTWQKRLEKVEAALAKLVTPNADPDDPPKGTPPEPVAPPKSDATPPPEPTKDNPPPQKTRGALHKVIFG